MQNANAYEEGLSPFARDFTALRRDQSGAEARVLGIMTLESTRDQYVGGAERPELVSPDSWTLDQHFLDLPVRKQIQVDLAFDYHSNVALYPEWQQWMRSHQPPTLIVWGENDPFFTADGARAFLHDLPHADLHLLQTGHFALEEKLGEIASHVARFMSAVSPS